MRHTKFSGVQIINNCDYLNICYYFLQLADDTILPKLEAILYDGYYRNYSLVTNLSNRDNIVLERKRRISMANLLIKNPEAFDFLVENDINVFHGTNGECLPSILEYGVNSSAECNRLGINVSTGEKWSRMYNERDYISFSDILDVSEKYATLDGASKNSSLSFPVIIGTNVCELEKANICSVYSDVSEIGVAKNFPLSGIKVILVPFDKVSIVIKLVDDSIKVFGIDYYYDKFYNLTDYGKIEVFDDKYEKYKNCITVSPIKKKLLKIKSFIVNKGSI